MTKEKEEEFDEFISLLIAQSRPCPTKFLQRYDDADFEYMKRKLKNFINKLLKDEREYLKN